MTLRLIIAPTALAVSLAEAKAHLRLDTADDDLLVTALIGAATEAAEHATGRALMSQTWEAGFDAFPTLKYRYLQDYTSQSLDEAICLTRVPVSGITSVTYIDALGLLQTLSPALYTLTQDDIGFARITPVYGTRWPEVRGDADGVKVRYAAGYASAAVVPEAIKSWIKLQIGSMYESREGEIEMRGVAIKLGFADAQLDRYRVYGAC